MAAKKARTHSGMSMIQGDSWGWPRCPSAWWAPGMSVAASTGTSFDQRSRPKKARPVRRLM